MKSLFDRHIIPQLGSMPVAEIKQSDIKAWINEGGDRVL